VRSIQLAGNVVFDEEELRKSLTLKKGSILNIYTVRNDVRRIEEMYKEKNYHNVNVSYQIQPQKNNQADVEYKIDEGKFAVDKATVADTVVEYLKRMAQIGKPVPYNKAIIVRRAATDLGDKRLDQLTTEVLVDWISGKRDILPSTRQQYVIYFRTVLTTAETLWEARPDMVSYERAARFMRTHGIIAESNVRDRRVSDDEISTIVDHFTHSRIPYEDILPFQLARAFRIGETCRLRWDDINEQDRTILIRQRKHPRKKRDEIAPLLGAAWDIVQRQPRGGEFIFPYKADSVSAGVTVAVAATGLEDLHLHDCMLIGRDCVNRFKGHCR
jgi:integrase